MSPTKSQPKSTGPKTESGKRISSQNSLRHGLASGTILIPGENPAEYASLENALFEQYQPANPTETLLVHDVAKSHWLKERAIRLQGEALAVAQPGEIPATFPVLLRYQTTNERAFHKALASLQTMQKERIDQAEQFASQEEQMRILQKIHAPLPKLADVMLADVMQRIKQRKEAEAAARSGVTSPEPAPSAASDAA